MVLLTVKGYRAISLGVCVTHQGVGSVKLVVRAESEGRTRDMVRRQASGRSQEIGIRSTEVGKDLGWSGAGKGWSNGWTGSSQVLLQAWNALSSHCDAVASRLKW